MRRARLIVVAVAATTLGGCFGTISANTVRGEIVRQTGQAPASEFEFNLGRMTTALIKAAIGPKPDGSLPLSGLSAIEIAVFELPMTHAATAVGLDFSNLTPYGWENVVRSRSENGSSSVMIRGDSRAIHDLALVVADREEVVFARLRGTLPTTLPEAIQIAAREGGTEPVKRQLLDAAGKAAPAR